MNKRPLAALAIVSFLLGACASSPGAPAATGAGSAATTASAAPMPVVRIGLNRTLTQSALLAAQRFGLFEKSGARVELVEAGNTQTNWDAFVGKSTDALLIIPNNVIAADAAGARYKAVVSTLNVSLINLVVRPGITSVADLKGKTGVSLAANDVRITLLSRYLEEHGMRATDVNWVSGGGTPAGLLAALVSGKADFTLLPAPELFQARSRGFKDLLEGKDFGLYPTQHLVFREDFIKTEPAAVRAIVQALAASIKTLQTDRDKAIPVLMEQLATQDRQVGEQAYDWLVPNYEAGCVALDGLERVKADVVVLSPTISQLAVSSVVDESFVRALGAAGGDLVTTKRCSK